MFYFPRFASYLIRVRWSLLTGFPHSDTSGSKVTSHLPEAFRRLVTSFIAFLSQGIHHAPFMIPVRNPENHLLFDAISISLHIRASGIRSFVEYLYTIRLSKFPCPLAQASPLFLFSCSPASLFRKKKAPPGAVVRGLTVPTYPLRLVDVSFLVIDTYSEYIGGDLACQPQAKAAASPWGGGRFQD